MSFVDRISCEEETGDATQTWERGVKVSVWKPGAAVSVLAELVTWRDRATSDVTGISTENDRLSEESASTTRLEPESVEGK